MIVPSPVLPYMFMVRLKNKTAAKIFVRIIKSAAKQSPALLAIYRPKIPRTTVAFPLSERDGIIVRIPLN
jgi:hypothetical protein